MGMVGGWDNFYPSVLCHDFNLILYIACKTIVSFADDVDDGKNIFIALFIMFSLTRAIIQPLLNDVEIN